jgi:hypothetical protein
MALMVGYAAAMDASMSEQGSQEISVATASVVGASSNLPEAWSEPQEGPSGVVQAQAQQAPEDWESQAEEDIDRDADKTSMSICISESGSKKSRGESLWDGALCRDCGKSLRSYCCLFLALFSPKILYRAYHSSPYDPGHHSSLLIFPSSYLHPSLVSLFFAILKRTPLLTRNVFLKSKLPHKQLLVAWYSSD